MNKKQVGQRSITPLLLLCLLFLAPFLLALWLYFFVDAEPGRGSNYGNLIMPPIVLPNDLTVFSANKPNQTRPLLTQWSLLYVIEAKCTEVCMRVLSQLYKIEQALGKDSWRVQRAVLLRRPSDNLAVFIQQYPGLWVLGMEGEQIFPLLAQQNNRQGDKLFLIDPLGNVIMSYPSNFDAVRLITDLRHLLKTSRIG